MQNNVRKALTPCQALLVPPSSSLVCGFYKVSTLPCKRVRPRADGFSVFRAVSRSCPEAVGWFAWVCLFCFCFFGFCCRSFFFSFSSLRLCVERERAEGGRAVSSRLSTPAGGFAGLSPTEGSGDPTLHQSSANCRLWAKLSPPCVFTTVLWVRSRAHSRTRPWLLLAAGVLRRLMARKHRTLVLWPFPDKPGHPCSAWAERGKDILLHGGAGLSQVSTLPGGERIRTESELKRRPRAPSG